MESELGRPIDRIEFLRDVLSELIAWRSRLGTDGFIRAWETSLAFRGEQIQLIKENEPPIKGELLGLEFDGSLRMKANDNILTVQIGEIHLRRSV